MTYLDLTADLNKLGEPVSIAKVEIAETDSVDALPGFIQSEPDHSIDSRTSTRKPSYLLASTEERKEEERYTSLVWPFVDPGQERSIQTESENSFSPFKIDTLKALETQTQDGQEEDPEDWSDILLLDQGNPEPTLASITSPVEILTDQKEEVKVPTFIEAEEGKSAEEGGMMPDGAAPSFVVIPPGAAVDRGQTGAESPDDRPEIAIFLENLKTSPGEQSTPELPEKDNQEQELTEPLKNEEQAQEKDWQKIEEENLAKRLVEISAIYATKINESGWCACGVGSTLRKAGLNIWGHANDLYWQLDKDWRFEKVPLADLRPGDIVYREAKPDRPAGYSWRGHIFIYQGDGMEAHSLLNPIYDPLDNPKIYGKTHVFRLKHGYNLDLTKPVYAAEIAEPQCY
ncbi:hypothetical protein GC174_08750 [bacterium]|nr:hypothetical protein [bacterium]